MLKVTHFFFFTRQRFGTGYFPFGRRALRDGRVTLFSGFFSLFLLLFYLHTVTLVVFLPPGS
jgi:hypothetical protein